MNILKTNYGIIAQITNYFKSLEKIQDLTFSQRRRLVRLNEEFAKEFKYFNNELEQIAQEHCEKDDQGNFIKMEGGGQKIKDDDIEIVNKKLDELYKTEVEIQYQPFKLTEKYFDNLKCDADVIRFIEENFLEE